MVITSTSAALQFALRYRDELFPGVPIVFVSVATPQGVTKRSVAGVTGVLRDVAFGETLELALTLHPSVKRVYVVAQAPSIDAFEARVRLVLDRFSERAEITFIKEATVPGLLAGVRAVPKDSVILYGRYTPEQAAHVVYPDEIAGLIAEAAPVPVYGTQEVYIGKGVVGGMIRSANATGTRVAEIARDILDGKRPEDIGIAELPATPTFDWRQVQRWGIDAARLPRGSAIQFRIPRAWEAYRPYIVGVFFIVVAQLLLITGLLTQRARRRRAEKESRQAEAVVGQLEARHTAMLRAIPDLMFVLTRDGTYVDYHARDPKLLFVPPSAFIGKTLRDVMPAPLAEMMMEAVERACHSGDAAVEYELQLGELRHYEARIVSAGDDRVLSIVRDVTDLKRAAALNRDLAGRLIVSQEIERQRIARELHDDLSQKIGLLNIEIEQVADELTAADLRGRLWTMSAHTAEIARALHNLSHGLHPSKLRTVGLLTAVQSVCRDMSDQMGIPIEVTHDTLPGAIDPNVSLCVYRVVQESLHNVARHSHAADVWVNLSHDAHGLTLEIADSGVGFDPHDTDREGLGLVSMRERVSFLRGQIVIHTAPGEGTRIVVRLPLTPVERSAPRFPVSA